MSHHRTLRTAVVAGLVPLALVGAAVAGVPTSTAVAASPASPATRAPTDPQAPPLKVTISEVSSPRYGDALTFKVASTGLETVGTVSHHGIELASLPLDRGGTVFSIPTTDRFRAGTSYRLDVEVTNETSSGQSQLRFTPSTIAGHVTPSSTSIVYSAPLYGVLAADAASPVAPTGTVTLVREGVAHVAGTLGNGGAFGLRDPAMAPGTHQVSVVYGGDGSYAPLTWTGAVTVARMPTTTRATLDRSDVVAGEAVSVDASAVPASAETTGSVDGFLVVSAAPTGSAAFEEIVRRPKPAGGDEVTIPLTDWAATAAAGSWTIRTTYSGSTFAASSSVDRTLRVSARPGGGEAVATTTALQVAPRAVVRSSYLATALVPGGVTGQVAFVVDGVVAATVPVGADGRAVARIPASTVGRRLVTARYLGSTTHAASTSPTRTVAVTKAASATDARAVVQRRTRAVRLAVVVRSALPVTGRVEVRRAGKVVARGVLTAAKRGRLALTTSRLPRGRQALQVRFLGSAEVAGSVSRPVRVRIR